MGVFVEVTARQSIARLSLVTLRCVSQFRSGASWITNGLGGTPNPSQEHRLAPRPSSIPLESTLQHAIPGRAGPGRVGPSTLWFRWTNKTTIAGVVEGDVFVSFLFVSSYASLPHVDRPAVEQNRKLRAHLRFVLDNPSRYAKAENGFLIDHVLKLTKFNSAHDIGECVVAMQ